MKTQNLNKICSPFLSIKITNTNAHIYLFIIKFKLIKLLTNTENKAKFIREKTLKELALK